MNTAAERILEEVSKGVHGKDEMIEKVLLAILARGHVLLEDIPGVGKTTLALAFSKVMQLDYNRVQFTPDVMPSDVTGFSIYRRETGKFEYVKGAALCNLFLADEINRTSSKTQSALLEVMEEGKITVDTISHETPKPFIVIATQNPIGHAGTQLLPESQLDRFMICLSMGYPNRNDEITILKIRSGQEESTEISPVIGIDELLSMQAAVDQVYLADSVYGYVADLAAATRNHDMVELGVSPRGSIALMRMAKAKAFLMGRDYVVPRDVADVMISTFSHRVVLKPKARTAHLTSQSLLQSILRNVAAPRVK